MWIEISAPGDRRIRMHHASVEDLKSKLEPGYSIIGIVSLCNERGEGGFVSPLNGPSLMGALLEAHGEELLAWLRARTGFSTELPIGKMREALVAIGLCRGCVAPCGDPVCPRCVIEGSIPTSDVNAG